MEAMNSDQEDPKLKPYGLQRFKGWCHLTGLSLRFGFLANKGFQYVFMFLLLLSVFTLYRPQNAT